MLGHLLLWHRGAGLVPFWLEVALLHGMRVALVLNAVEVNIIM